MPAIDAVTDANGTAIFVGNSAGQTYPLAPGQAKSFKVANLNMIYIKRAGGTNVTVEYIGC
jgi:hypothetical protein